MDDTAGMRTIPTAPRRTRRGRPLAAVLLITGLALTACGGGSGGSAGASSSALPGSGGGAGKGADSGKAVKYAECMRKNGVPDFPDPQGGKIQIKAGPGSDLNPDSPQFKGADQKCKAYAPSGTADNGQGNAAMLKFAACMRKNGVPNFPDPEGGKMIIAKGQGVDPDAPQFKAAQKTCQKLLPGGLQ
ncbi:hypothetical protein [Actinoallomurus rhizosphaericola]|uniref:hypothetical protein n=1 Tax=Actinoallomurus rhizosphaericola TaxID=2952536 RepID=UPI002093E0AF|nr:hypothetical protein [Actinoallomurus rhizosphaericola]MCO5997538.1 hypothetical protein [Actinoallomurus rhizosphaericola]